jgi:hypothetical protein
MINTPRVAYLLATIVERQSRLIAADHEDVLNLGDVA